MSCIAKCCGKIPFEKIKFLECVQDGDLAGAEATYNEYEDKLKLLEFHDSHGRNAIHIAAYNGYLEVVGFLLEKMEEHHVSPNYHGPNMVNAISYACMRGYKEKFEDNNREGIVRLMIQAGAEINTVNKMTKMSPLHWACFHDDPATIELLLLHNADESLRTREKMFAIDIAGQKNLFKNIKVLVDDYKTRHKDDLPRISELGNKVHPESINTPRQVIPVQTKTKTTKEEIASRILFWGSMINDSETVNLIILKGISPFILQYRQMNSVMIAADHDSLVSFDAILSYDYTKDGLPYIKEGMNKMDRDGNNPLHHACLMNNAETYERLHAGNYIDKNARNAYGFLPHELTTAFDVEYQAFEYCFIIGKEHEDELINQFHRIGLDIRILDSKKETETNIIFRVPEKLYMKTATELKIKIPTKRDKLLIAFNEEIADQFMPFMPRHRHTMIDYLLAKEIPELSRYKKIGMVKDYFPLHNEYRKDMTMIIHDRQFKLMWGWLFGQSIKSLAPLHHIANYHGEKIAWYFAWMTFYTAWLLIPIIPGIAVGIVQLINYKIDTIIVPFYCIFMFLWFTVFTQVWKRRQKELAAYWNCSSFRRRDAERPEYKGEITINPSTMQKRKKAYTFSFLRNIFVSLPTLATWLSAIVAAFIAFRVWLATDSSLEHVVLVGAVNACVITILNYAYKYLSVLLVNWENHRYEQQWDDSYCTKNFALQFVNTYISLFATVLYDKDLEKLAINLASILVVKQFSMNLLEILFPKFKYKFQLSRFTKKWKTKPDQKATDYLALQIIKDQMMGKSDRLALQYSEMVIQLGFVTLFAPAFPAAAIFCFINNILEVRGEINDFGYVKKRTHAEGGSGIGAWIPIIDLMSYISVVTNCVIIFLACESWEEFLEDEFDMTDPIHQIYVVIIAEHLAVMTKMLIGKIISEVPNKFMEEQEFTRKSQKLLTEALKAGDDPRKMGELQKSHEMERMEAYQEASEESIQYAGKEESTEPADPAAKQLLPPDLTRDKKDA